jgi:hypothetical protein
LIALAKRRHPGCLSKQRVELIQHVVVVIDQQQRLPLIKG